MAYAHRKNYTSLGNAHEKFALQRRYGSVRRLTDSWPLLSLLDTLARGFRTSSKSVRSDLLVAARLLAALIIASTSG